MRCVFIVAVVVIIVWAMMVSGSLDDRGDDE